MRNSSRDISSPNRFERAEEHRLDRRSFARWAMSASVLSALGASADRPSARQSVKIVAAITRGLAYLVNMFDPKMDLLPEYEGSRVYWLYHDNYLAAKLLEPIDKVRATRIKNKIASLGVEKSGKIEILFEEAEHPLPFRTYELTDVTEVDGKKIRTEKVTDKPLKGWEEYADLLCLAAIAEKKPELAAEHLDRAAKMWDGTGLADRVVAANKLYASYKLALLILAAQRLHQTISFAENAFDRLLSLQNEKGGIVTDYDREGNPVGMANVETTCMALLAFQSLGQGR